RATRPDVPASALGAVGSMSQQKLQGPTRFQKRMRIMNSGQVRLAMKVICTMAVCAALIVKMAAPVLAQTPTQDPGMDSDSSADSTVNPGANVTSPNKPNAEILKELQLMRARIAEL